jgi:Ca-activated chloride channel family protein
VTDWIDWQARHPELVHLAWAVLAVVAGIAALELRSRGALGTFLSPAMQRRLTAQASPGRAALRLALILAALLAGVGALMRPQARGTTETVAAGQVAADVVFLLDVSRSMLAEDAAPNRLARAKSEIAQLVAKLDGQRVGLIAFAGRAAQVCPLTADHAFFGTVLSTVDTRSAGRGGTRIGEAVRTALKGFPSGPGGKLIVLITDGDDDDSYPLEAAKAARDAGVKIVAIGIGSETGSQIMITNPSTGAKEPLMHDHAPVISKLDGGTLRQMALTTEGAYIPAGTAAVDLESIMESHVRPIVRAAGDAATRVVPAERFQWPVLAALVCLLGALWVGASQRRAS